MLREIAREYVLIPTGEAAIQFQGIMSLNESGLLLWKKLQNGCTESDMIDTLLQEYDTTREEAARDVAVFLKQLTDQKLLVTDAQD